MTLDATNADAYLCASALGAGQPNWLASGGDNKVCTTKLCIALVFHSQRRHGLCAQYVAIHDVTSGKIVTQWQAHKRAVNQVAPVKQHATAAQPCFTHALSLSRLLTACV